MRSEVQPGVDVLELVEAVVCPHVHPMTGVVPSWLLVGEPACRYRFRESLPSIFECWVCCRRGFHVLSLH